MWCTYVECVAPEKNQQLQSATPRRATVGPISIQTLALQSRWSTFEHRVFALSHYFRILCHQGLSRQTIDSEIQLSIIYTYIYLRNGMPETRTVYIFGRFRTSPGPTGRRDPTCTQAQIFLVWLYCSMDPILITMVHYITARSQEKETTHHSLHYSRQALGLDQNATVNTPSHTERGFVAHCPGYNTKMKVGSRERMGPFLSLFTNVCRY